MRNKDKLIRIVENDVAIVGLRSDGILHVYNKRDVELNKGTINQLFELVKEFAYPNKYPFLVEMDDYVSFQDEGRKYMAEIDAVIPSTKTAIFIETVGYELVVKHFLNKSQLQKEHNIFKDFDAAVAWLKK